METLQSLVITYHRFQKRAYSCRQGNYRYTRLHALSSYTDMAAQITAYAGLLTYKYPDRKHRELIVEPQSIRISAQSAMLGEVTESMTLSSLPKAVEEFAQATENASKRVFFKAGKDGDSPRPILIASPTYFDQPVIRPYEYPE